MKLVQQKCHRVTTNVQPTTLTSLMGTPIHRIWIRRSPWYSVASNKIQWLYNKLFWRNTNKSICSVMVYTRPQFWFNIWFIILFSCNICTIKTWLAVGASLFSSFFSPVLNTMTQFVSPVFRTRTAVWPLSSNRVSVLWNQNTSPRWCVRDPKQSILCLLRRDFTPVLYK